MESAKGFIFLVLCCSLMCCIEARPHEKKKTVKHWWDEDWSKYFKEGQDSQKSDNHVADSQYHKDSKDSKAQVPVKPKDSLVKAKAEESKPAKEASVKPLGKHLKPTLYNPTEENRWGDKYGDYNKFVEDDDDVKDYTDYDDLEDLEDEDSDEDYSDEDTDLYDSEEEEEEKDYKEIDEAKAEKAAQDSKNKVESDVSEKKATNYHNIGFDTGIVPEEKHADEKELMGEQKESSKESMIDMFPDVDAHSVKKDLMNPAFMKDYTNTKPDLKTSPNPPPPGLGESKLTMVTPSSKKTDAQQKMALIQSKPLTMCQVNADCRVGRMCHENVCFCLPSDGCQRHYKPVCGSDNNWYPSHCELHRSACIHGQHIKIDHTGLCFKTQEKVIKEQALAKAKEQDIGPVVDKSEIDIDSDIPQDAIKSPIINSAEIYDYPKGSPKGKEVVKEKPTLYDDNKVSLSDKMKVKTVEGKGAERKKDCTREEYESFKQKLLEYHCEKFTEPNCRTEVQEEREYLATLMFSFYDRDLDFYLEEEEANEMEQKEHFSRLSVACVLADIITYADHNPADGRMSVSEFIAAFNGSMDMRNLKQEAQVIPTLATVGNGLELKCGVGSDVVWRRFSTDIHDLNNDELTVNDDGFLYFSKVGVHHIGNYTCEDRNNPLQTQIHSLSVQMRPVVHVSPSSQMTESRSDIVIKCHAEGIPHPKISWRVNEMDIPDIPSHFLKSHGNDTLTVLSADYLRDTGAYKCIAKNQAGEAEDVASVFIQNPNKTQGYYDSSQSYGSFIAFHRKGYTVYDPTSCMLEREVEPAFGNFKFIPDNIDAPLRLCDVDAGCEWGAAVGVKDFVYASQPKLNRVVIVETKKLNPIQVIDTDKTPMALHYVEHLDQVWVLCWNSETDGSLKTIVVIRDASKYIEHHAVHTQPVGDRFDMVQDLFLPPGNDLHHAYSYGYVTHNNQQGLFKLNLKKMKYVKAIDFSAYNCVPKTVVFVPIGGHVIVQCVSKATHETTQLVMDYLTDVVKSKKVVTGKPYVSPDSRHIVTVDDFSGKVSVLTVSNDGMLESEFEVTLSCSISDLAFFSSATHVGYDVVLTSADDEDIFFLSLTNGKLDKIKGSTLSDRDWKPQPMKKTLIPGGMFNDYLLSSLPAAVRIINGRQHSVQCTFEGPINTHVISFVDN